MNKNSIGPPFSLLSKSEEKDLSSWFAYETHPPDTLIMVQEISRLDKLYIVSRGSAVYYFEIDHRRELHGKLKPGDNFGGISILMNSQIAIRTLKTREETVFLTIDAASFLELCKKNPGFQSYFTDAFGHLMLDPAFAGIIARRIRDKALNLPFFNQPISAIFRPNIATCPLDTPAAQAAQKMSRHNASAILIKDKQSRITGIVTDADLREKVLANGLAPDTAVSDIMSSPLISISAYGQVFEAFLTMIQKDKRHLGVFGKSGNITGILSEKELIASQTRSTFLLIKTIKSAHHLSQIENIHEKLCTMLLDPIRNGANPEYITRLITTFSDAVIDKVMELSIREAGPPPCSFVFLTMGSEGREEQTLISDQDNAIVFEDIEDKTKAAQAKAYFDALARKVCERLDRAGYRFCEGDNMAQNPRWCQPLSVWKQYFNQWIRAGKPEDLLYSSIFFDFKGTYGDLQLAEDLKSFLLDAIRKWSGFLRNMTENTLYFKPPIGMFGKFIVETEGPHKDSLDIKYAILPIIDFARIYALKNSIRQTNTMVRLFRLYTKHALTSKEYTDILQAYNFLMNLRFRRQITTIMDEHMVPDNYINPRNLSHLDRHMLREVFRMVEKLQQKIGVEFTGVI
jgi:CBS domain-containing protein